MALALTGDGLPSRQRALTAYYVVVGLATAVITMTQVGPAVTAVRAYPSLWLMIGLAVAAALFSFVDTASGARPATVVSPTVCFTFAILLCWGLGPALLAQFLAIVVIAWKLKRPVREALDAAGRNALSFAAASAVLWVGQPDPFEHNGPTNLFVDAVSVVGAAAAWLVTYYLLTFVAVRLHTGSRPAVPGRSQVAVALDQALFRAALLLLAPVLAVAAHINIGFVPLVFVPLFAVQRMAGLLADRDRAARTDPLTGLANRAGLKSAFEGLERARPTSVTLLLLDLDHFKDVNDALGHDVGDQLLAAVADRLNHLGPVAATVARLGGDVFAVLAATGNDEEAAELARGVVAALSEPVRCDRLRIDVTASIGVARHHADEEFGDLMRHADLAMYDAKQRGDAIATYAERSDQSSPERLTLLTDLRDALVAGDREHIALHYQPQVALATGEIEGVEALLRWRHPVHGPIGTRDLLSVVEHSSVMQLLTTRVIDDVLSQVAEWNLQGVHLRASLNVSARDLYSDDLVPHLAEQLALHRVDPHQLQVEITESALLADPSRAQATVARIAALGVAVSLDDFGTGYSSLQHLRKLPIAEIKIDRMFVGGMAGNSDDAAIVRSTVDMARSLGIRTVAEGVETQYTRQLLEGTGCTLAQGWLTAHPMPGPELAGWIATEAGRTQAVPASVAP